MSFSFSSYFLRRWYEVTRRDFIVLKAKNRFQNPFKRSQPRSKSELRDRTIFRHRDKLSSALCSHERLSALFSVYKNIFFSVFSWSQARKLRLFVLHSSVPVGLDVLKNTINPAVTHVFSIRFFNIRLVQTTNKRLIEEKNFEYDERRTSFDWITRERRLNFGRDFPE